MDVESRSSRWIEAKASTDEEALQDHPWKIDEDTVDDRDVDSVASFDPHDDSGDEHEEPLFRPRDQKKQIQRILEYLQTTGGQLDRYSDCERMVENVILAEDDSEAEGLFENDNSMGSTGRGTMIERFVSRALGIDSADEMSPEFIQYRIKRNKQRKKKNWLVRRLLREYNRPTAMVPPDETDSCADGDIEVMPEDRMRELGYHVSDTPEPSECASPPRPPSTSTGSSSTAEWRPPGGSRRFNQWLEDGPARNTRAARGRAENLEGGVGRERRETNEIQQPQPSLTQSSRRGILKNRQGSRAVSTAALTDIIANHANQETNPNVESEHTATVGSGLYVELPEQTQPTSQCDASTVPTQHDNQDEETITVPRSNTEGVPENRVTGQGLVICWKY